MANKISYNGSSKLILRICQAINDIITNGAGGGLTTTTATLLSTGWGGNSAPYNYNLGSTYSGKKVFIGYDASSPLASSSNLKAASDAKIVGGESTYIYAYGEKPTVSIPILITYG